VVTILTSIHQGFNSGPLWAKTSCKL